jgi:putative ABC transport system permease protein
MKLQDFRVGLRILIKDPAYSLVAIVGLGVGLAVCLLLLGYARYCWQYNAHVPDADNVYIVKQRKNFDLGTPWIDQAPVLLREAAKSAPGVTAASGYVTWFPLTVKANGPPRKLKNLTLLPGFAEMAGLQAIKGDLDEALSRPDSFAITQDTAVRLFGTSEVLGRTVQLSTVDDGNPTNKSNCNARIAAILRNPPANTTIPFEAVNGLNLCLVPPWMRAEALSGAMGFPGTLLIHVHPGASLAAVSDALQDAVDSAPRFQRVAPQMKDRLAGRKVIDIKLSRLRDAYFDREVTIDRFSLPVDRGDSAVVAGLVAIGVLILGLAAVNYVNLATIRVIRRQREIATRKVLGARKGRLARQFVAESLLVSTLATAIGLLLAWLALPVFGKLMNRDLGSVLSVGNIAAAIGLGLILGLLTALYPASIVFGVRPSRLLAGRPDTESFRSKRLRQALSVLQVGVAMGLASYTMAIFWQTRFAMDASPGFDPSPLLVFELPDAITGRSNEDARNFMTALAQQPGVAGIAQSIDPIGRSKDRWSAEIKREGGEGVTMDVKSVSASFFEQYGIRAVAGRLFDPKIDKEQDAIPLVINAIAARQLGFASPELAVGQALLFDNLNARTEGNDAPILKRIVGIAPEIRFHSLREAPRAVAYELKLADVTLTVRASASIPDADRAVRALWSQYFPNAVLEMSPAKDIYAANYADDARLAKLLSTATIIAMILAACGAYVLAADAVQRRTGEIALRKLFGARPNEIGKLVAREVGVIVLLAAVIALPLAALAIARYLAVYTEQTPLAFWTLAFALVAAVGAVALAAGRHAWIAMSLKPAVALRG